jgi:SAM-dependent methyltransferase
MHETTIIPCPVCGGLGLQQHDVLWPELVAAWELTPEETRRINRQQGECCTQCGANLRSRTLAGGFLECLNWPQTLRDMNDLSHTAHHRILEINAAGTLSPYLSKFRHYRLIEYPEFDMQKLELPADSYDFVIHSDTLEHVPDPVAGLRECRRVLRPSGTLVLTIPIVPTRLTRRRTNLPPAYHGNPGEKPEDQIVHTEYGADFYLDFIAAGWTKVSLFTLGTPDALAVIGTK